MLHFLCHQVPTQFLLVYKDPMVSKTAVMGESIVSLLTVSPSWNDVVVYITP